jgi:hypothetical protein
MPVKIEQHTCLKGRDPKGVQAMTEKALETKHGFEGGRLTVVTLKRSHRRSIAEDRRTGKESMTLVSSYLLAAIRRGSY